MHSEEILAMLLKSGVERGPEGGSRTTIPASGAIDGGVSESNAPLLKERDKKRHRDGGGSRTHHSKKAKDPVMHLGSDKSLVAAKTGVDSCL